MRNSRTRHNRRAAGRDGTQWLSFSDLMSSLLLIFVLILFAIMYQYLDLTEITTKKIAEQQNDLTQAQADLENKTTKLSAAEAQMLVQQIKLTAAQQDLDDANSILAAQQEELAATRSELEDKQSEIDAQQASLDTLSTQLAAQQTQIDEQASALEAKQSEIDTQQASLNTLSDQLAAQQTQIDTQQATLDDQAAALAAKQAEIDNQQTSLNTLSDQLTEKQSQIDAQQATLDDQQRQIEELVGMRPRIVSSISQALREANINAEVDPNTGAVTLESNVLFETGKFDLSSKGKAFIDRFLPVYLDVLFSDEYMNSVAEVIIEGHTDSQGNYIDNLELSQRRALAVARYVLADGYKGISDSQKSKLRGKVTANGRSFSDLIYNADGSVNMDASRRVVFKFRLTDEQMIQQLKNILEAEG